MTEEKSWIYTLILGICMILILFLIGKMMLDTPVVTYVPRNINNIEVYNSEDSTIDVGENSEYKSDLISELDLNNMAHKVLGENFPIKNMKFSISDDYTVRISGDIEKKLLESYIIGYNENASYPLRIALKILPEKFNIDMVFSVRIDDDNGMLIISPVSVKSGDLNIPYEALISSVFYKINEVINDALYNNSSFITQVKIVNGGIEIPIY